MTESAPTVRQIALVTGMGIGEETKGATVQWLVRLLGADTVIRHGGSQAAHLVRMEDGREHMFRHFGSGMFEGANTHLQHMVIDPVSLFTEALELEKQGIDDPFGCITIDAQCLGVTPFHGAMSRLREYVRGAEKKGTIGTGVGEAIADAATAELTIRAGEFSGDTSALFRKIENIRQAKLAEAVELIRTADQETVSKDAYAELDILYNKKLVEVTVQSFDALSGLVRIVGPDYFTSLLRKNGSIVGEGSHGALLHPRFGFIPHVTQVDPLGAELLQNIHEQNYTGNVIRMGVSRCYMTRHGAGPLVSYNRELTAGIHEGSTNANPVANNWLGEFRNGNYDIVAMKYALDICGGPAALTGLAISYLDVLKGYTKWDVCTGYTFEGNEPDLADYFDMDGNTIVGIKMHPDTDRDTHFRHQEKLTKLLKQCHPILTTLKPGHGSNLEDVFLGFVEKQLGVPVIATARGPMASDRQVRAGYENVLRPIVP